VVSGARSSKRSPQGTSKLQLIAVAAVALILGFRKNSLGPPAAAQAIGHRRSEEVDRHGDVRGRMAETPADIPSSGWKDVLWRVYGRLGEDRVLVIAAGTTFYGLLSLFPAIAAFVSLYGMFADPGNIARLINKMSTFLPGGAIDVIGSEITRVASQGSAKLGFATLFALLISLWSANAGMKAMFDGMNVAYKEREKRGIIALNLTSLCFTMCMIAFGIVSLVVIVAVPYISERMGEVGGWIVTIAQWPVLLVLVSFVFACLYRFGPSREAPQWRWLTWGSAVASVIWLIASILFSWYAANFASYNKTYGSLGAIIGLMTWMWISTVIFILGAMLNAEMEHQTKKDTTRGQPQPMGSRGAYVADTVGEAR